MSSGFQDNFKRDSAEEDMLEYDDSAFYYFSFSILSFVLLPFTWYTIKRIYTGMYDLQNEGIDPETPTFQKLLAEKRKQAKSAIWNVPFIFRLTCLVCMWVLWYLNFDMVSKIQGLQSFDPYQVLDISPDTELKDIRKQYRRMSLAVHPDKNPDNPLAVQEFIRLTKAYNILTDDTARENFQKYGNPDGPGSYNVAIALPRFLMKQENQILVLCVAFFILLVVIPAAVFFNFADSTTKDEQGVLLENKRWYGSELNENYIFKNVPLSLYRALEYQEVAVRSESDLNLVKKLGSKDSLEEFMPKTKSRKTANLNLKPLVLMLAHMHRMPEIEGNSNPELAADLAQIRKITPGHINCMLTVAMELVQMLQKGMSKKVITCRTIETLLHFGQAFVQGLWERDNAMKQIPHFTDQTIKDWNKAVSKNKFPSGGIVDFCKLSPAQRMDLGLLDKSKMNEVEAVVRILPLAECSASAYVENQEDIFASDFITWKFSIKYSQLKDKEYPGYVHSNCYPHLKRQAWWIIVSSEDKSKIVLVHKIVFRAEKNEEGRLAKIEEIRKEPLNEQTLEMRQRMGRAGHYKFSVTFINDSYMGFDQTIPFQFQVQEDPKEAEMREYSAEDQIAVKGGGMLQQMMSMDNEETDEEEEEAEGENGQTEPLDEMEKLRKRLKDAGLEDALQDDNQLAK